MFQFVLNTVTILNDGIRNIALRRSSAVFVLVENGHTAEATRSATMKARSARCSGRAQGSQKGAEIRHHVRISVRAGPATPVDFHRFRGDDESEAHVAEVNFELLQAASTAEILRLILATHHQLPSGPNRPMRDQTHRQESREIGRVHFRRLLWKRKFFSYISCMPV